MFELPHAFLTDAEDSAEFFQGRAVLGEAALADNRLLTLRKFAQGLNEPACPRAAVVNTHNGLLRIRTMVGEEILPAVF